MRRAVLAVLLLLAVVAAPSAGGASAGDPPLSVPTSTLAAALSCPDAFIHPEREPVLLVHGTAVTAEEHWGWNYWEQLPAAGFDVCAVHLPARALGDIQVASEYVVYAIRSMAARAGGVIDVIGHSQGGLEPRWALRWWPSLRGLVDDFVALAAPNHGTWSADSLCPSSCAAAVHQMKTTSRFIEALNSVDETPGDVDYTNIYTLTDELVQPAAPVATSATDGATNILLQDVCPGRPAHHVGLNTDPAVYEMVIDAFINPGGTDLSRFDPATCARDFMPGVNAADAVAGNAMIYGNGYYGFSTATTVSEEPPLAPYATW